MTEEQNKRILKYCGWIFFPNYKGKTVAEAFAKACLQLIGGEKCLQ